MNFSNLTIEHARGPEFYYVDLERCLSSAEVLDWIIQIERKRWGGGVVEELVWLLNLLLESPGASLRLRRRLDDPTGRNSRTHSE